MKGIEVKGVTTEVAVTYKFELDHGWLSVTVNEKQGSIDIQSDWGNGAARWPGQAGEFEEFLGRIDADYLNRNLRTKTFMGQPMKERAVDWEGAEKRLKAKIIEARRTGEFLKRQPTIYRPEEGHFQLDKDQARDWWDEVELWCSDHDKSMETAYHTYPDAVAVFTDGEPWFFLEEKPTAHYEFWMQHLLPAVLGYFKKKAEERHVRRMNGHPC